MKSSFSFQIKRKKVKQVLVIYACSLFYIVFLTPNRHKGGIDKHNFIPVYKIITMIHKPEDDHFWTYYIGYWGNLFGNVLLFIPFGFLIKWLLPYTSNKLIFLYGLMISVSIELLQLWLQIGVCDIDDVLLNAAGVIAGIVIYQKWSRKIIAFIQ